MFPPTKQQRRLQQLRQQQQQQRIRGAKLRATLSALREVQTLIEEVLERLRELRAREMRSRIAMGG